VPASIRRTQAGLEKVKARLGEVDGSTFSLNLGPLGSIKIQKNLNDGPSAPPRTTADEPGAHEDAQ
jgi:hypothetical protein